MATWLKSRALNVNVFYKQLAINGLILCPLTLVGVFRQVYLRKNSPAASSASVGSTPLHSAQLHVPVPRTYFADSNLLRLSTPSSHWTSRDENHSWHGAMGSPGSAAHCRHRLRQELCTHERSSTPPWLPGLWGSRLPPVACVCCCLTSGKSRW